MSTRTIAIFSVLALCFFHFPMPALAQTGALKGALQSIVEGLSKMTSLRSPKDVLVTRRATFQSVLDLALTESNDLKNRLIKIENLSGKELDIKEQYLRELGNHTNYYQSLAEELERATTIGKIREIANQFKDWRRVVYHPMLQRVVNFLLVVESKQALQIAELRYARIATDLKKVSGYSLIKQSPLIEQLATTRKALDAAQQLQTAASILITKTSDTDTQPIVTEIQNHIKTAYGYFMQMSAWLREASR